MGRFTSEKRGDVWHVVDTTTDQALAGLDYGNEMSAAHAAYDLNAEYESLLMEAAG